MFKLPEIGKTEDQELDFKQRISTTEAGKADHLEAAKDIAAMANAYGGTLIVGACEAPKGTLSKYDPMTKTEAAAACTEYTTALRDRVRPAAIIATDVVAHEKGFLALINIEPSMGQAIGIRFISKKDLDASETKRVDAYGFPVRVGANTNWFEPEQLPMLMLPGLRRTLLLLRTIGTEVVSVDALLKGGEVDHGGKRYKVAAISADENVVRLTDDYCIPLDAITTVNRDKDAWRIRYRQS
jgi:hypothetical protein